MGHSPATSDRFRAAILLGVGETAFRIPAHQRGLLGLAVLLNLLLFAVGVYFELHPRDSHDRWSAAGVAAVALLNSTALSVPAGRAVSTRFLHRMRRIALIANSLVLAAATLFVSLEGLRHWEHAAIHGVALMLPPIFTLLALQPLLGRR